MVLSNAFLKLEFDETSGRYSVFDLSSGRYRIRNASFSSGQYASLDAEDRTVAVKNVTDAIGNGTAAVFSCRCGDGSVLSLETRIYENTGAFTTRLLLKNRSGEILRIRQMAHLITEGTRESYFAPRLKASGKCRMLTGEAGFSYARLIDGLDGKTLNVMTFVWQDAPEYACSVIGALTMYEFQTEIVSRSVPGPEEGCGVSLEMFDATGKLVAPEADFISDFAYFDVIERDPFEALKQYASRMAAFMNVRLNHYNRFVSVCLWYVFAFSLGDRSANTSTGGIEEAKAMIRSGITRYAPPLIRLVPDEYVNPNEQLWWDEEHWQRYGHLTAPYETLKSWVDALHGLGGEGGLYMQPTFRSDDYCAAHPGHMLFNDERNEADYTDPGFIAHMREVYRKIRDAGIVSMFYDYSMLVRGSIKLDENALLRDGGFEDPDATSVSAYRNIFRIAKEVCGPELMITENTWNYSGQDLAIGLIDAQRSKMDNVGMNREVINSGIRQWYRNKVTKLIDPDVKNFTVGDRDIRRKEVSLMGLLFGKTMLGSSILRYDSDSIRDIGRIFPMPEDDISAAPLDLFLSEDEGTASVFDYALSRDEHIVALLNEEMKQAEKTLPLSGERVFGGLGLDPAADYDVWDFWNEDYVGRRKGKETLRFLLRKGECRVLAVRKTRSVPYVLSTNRHILQGVMETETVSCTEDSVTLKLRLVGNDPMHAVLALPSERSTLLEASANDEKAAFRAVRDRFDPLVHLYAESPENGDITVSVKLGAGRDESAETPQKTTGLSAAVDPLAGAVTLSWNTRPGLRTRILKDGKLLKVTEETSFIDTAVEEDSVLRYRLVPENARHQKGRPSRITVRTGEFRPALHYGEGGASGRFGSQGRLLFNSLGKGQDHSELPDYVKEVTVEDRKDYVYEAGENDRRVIPQAGAQPGTLGMVHDDRRLNIRITFSDRKKHRITLYSVDCNRSGRTMKLTVLDRNGRTVIPGKLIPEYGEGVHMSFTCRGAADISLLNGAVNACVSAVYFDEA